MERTTAAQLCSIAVLLSTALLLPAGRGAQASPPPQQWAQGPPRVLRAHRVSLQALGHAGPKDVAAEQDLAKASILEPPEEVKPGTKVFSSSTWAQRDPHQAQVGPEEDRDHLYHPQDDAREADVQGPPQMLSLEVQSGPEEDRDHIYHS